MISPNPAARRFSVGDIVRVTFPTPAHYELVLEQARPSFTKDVTIIRIRSEKPDPNAPYDSGRYLNDFPYEGEWLNEHGGRERRFIKTEWCAPEPVGKADMAARAKAVEHLGVSAASTRLPWDELDGKPNDAYFEALKANTAHVKQLAPFTRIPLSTSDFAPPRADPTIRWEDIKPSAKDIVSAKITHVSVGPEGMTPGLTNVVTVCSRCKGSKQVPFPGFAAGPPWVPCSACAPEAAFESGANGSATLCNCGKDAGLRSDHAHGCLGAYITADVKAVSIEGKAADGKIWATGNVVLIPTDKVSLIPADEQIQKVKDEFIVKTSGPNVREDIVIQQIPVSPESGQLLLEMGEAIERAKAELFDQYQVKPEELAYDGEQEREEARVSFAGETASGVRYTGHGQHPMSEESKKHFESVVEAAAKQMQEGPAGSTIATESADRPKDGAAASKRASSARKAYKRGGG